MPIECFKCGECCRRLFSTLIVTREELDLIEEKTGIRLPVKKEVRTNRFSLAGEACPFLKNNQCSIHAFRPCMCRMWHCGRLKAEDKPLEYISEIKRLMVENPEYRLFKEKMENEAVEWGNKHGWNWRKR
jgi:Fe-S-cluster containining protein